MKSLKIGFRKHIAYRLSPLEPGVQKVPGKILLPFQVDSETFVSCGGSVFYFCRFHVSTSFVFPQIQNTEKKSWKMFGIPVLSPENSFRS